MSTAHIPRKWRPSLGLVVFSVLLSVLALPAAIVIWFRALDNTTSRMGPIEAGALLVALLITLVIAYVLTRTITKPIEALVQRAREIAIGGRAAIRPLGSYGTREIATLSQSLLDLAERLVDRGDYVQSFAAHVSHELKSPLTAIKGAAELLREADTDQPMTPAQRRHFLDQIVADTDRLAALLGRLRDLARAEQPMARGSVTMAEIAADLHLRYGHLGIEADGGRVPPLALSREAAAIIFGHLGDNAAQHGATSLVLTATMRDGRVVVRFADDGTGISPGNRDRIFQPFFSTRREQGGTGMGLEIVRTMLASHDGTINLVDSAKGAQFEIAVPPAR